MTKRGPSREILAVVPWLAAAAVWFGLVSPMRADQEKRLSEQSTIRRERVKAERGLRETQALHARIGSALATVCRDSSDPAALRQRAIAATAGLPLSPFGLAVTGGPGGGAVVDASGTPASALELLRRLGDPGRGGFLRGVSIRSKGGIWSISATTGVFESFPQGPPPRPCPGVSDSPPAEPGPEPQASKPPPGPRPVRPVKDAAPPAEPGPATPSAEPAPAPFTLVAFLISEGKSRVSIRVGAEVRVVSVGDSVDGWKCVAIDRDEGAVFTSAQSGRVVLKAGPSER